jgi:hypothetical protein
MKTLVRIIAQYYENYSDSNVPYWKPKMGQEFTLRVESDHFMYTQENAIESIKKLLAEQSDSHNRYEYVSHELVFFEPIALDAAKFETLIHAANEITFAKI